MQGIGRRKPAHVPPTSDELIETYRQTARPEDFEQIVRRFAALVFSECRRITGNSHDAEDASQLVFLALVYEIKSGTQIRHISAWLQRVARRQAMKVLRTRTRQRKRDDAARRPELQITSGDHALDAPVAAGIVRDAIDALPERYRLPVILHYFGGMDLERVANELKLKKQAVATRLFRGRKMLAERLARSGIALDEPILASALAFFVPTTVVNGVVGSIKSVSAASTAAELPAAISHTLQTILLASAISRPLRIGMLILLLASGGTSLAWMVTPPSLRRTHWPDFNLMQWLEKLVPSVNRPRLQSSNTVAAPVVPVTPAEQLIPKVRKDAPTPAPVCPEINQAVASAKPPVAQSTEISKPTPQSTAAAATVQPPVPVGKGVQHTPPVIDVLVRPRVNAPAAPHDLTVGAPEGALLELPPDRLEVSRLSIGDQRHSTGELHVNAAEIILSGPGAAVIVGGSGSGSLYLGTRELPGRITSAPGVNAPFVIRATPQGRGLVQGWGMVGTGGTLTNNGRVVADGFDHTRSLDLREFSEVTNTIDNPAGGNNGWFVRRGGRLTLPALDIQRGTHTYTWGESAEGPLDLVNSLRLTIHNQPSDAKLSISLRTIALADPLDIALPDQMSVIGLWEFTGGDLSPTALDVLVRYNEIGANAFFPGEEGLQLIAYEQGEWRVAGDLWRDSIHNWIGGSFDGPIDYLAVGIPWQTQLLFPASLDAALPMPLGTVPEPSTLALTCALIFHALLRRRSRH